ncbi:hypothetical protein, partial [Arthrobacter mobilis]|uniref:hypothetical protein n=1 Tax=Arthrobacter mobilis TaxID=2724944 RepID=UPI00197BA461
SPARRRDPGPEARFIPRQHAQLSLNICSSASLEQMFNLHYSASYDPSHTALRNTQLRGTRQPASPGMTVYWQHPEEGRRSASAADPHQIEGESAA